MIKIAIFGASGYTGIELLRILLNHGEVEIKALTGETQAGKMAKEVFPHLSHIKLPNLIRISEVNLADIDLVFCCLPHGTTQEIIANLPQHIRIVDLSADFRLRNLNIYAKHYGHKHLAPHLQKEVIYGLPEFYRSQIKKARIVANTGCYPVCSLLPLVPIANIVNNIIIDAKSGVSGAGRAAKRNLLFAEIDGGISAYAVASHRHIPEIEQELAVAGNDEGVNFTPHLMPMKRGMLTTIYAKGNFRVVQKKLQEFYEDELFVEIVAQAPSTHQVIGTNMCKIAVFKGRKKNDIIIVSVIDNLCKGASTQAVQNMNIMFDFPENTGLKGTAILP